jgi:hypothetical protein
MITDSYTTAIHEAGHALLVVLTGGVVEQANVKRNGRQIGEVTHRGVGDDATRRIAVSLGGMVAESFAAGGNGDPTSSLTGDADWRKIDGVLRECYGENSKPRQHCPEYRLALAVTRRLLADNWGAVLHIAKRLLSHQRVSGRLAHAVVAAHRVSLEEDD